MSYIAHMTSHVNHHCILAPKATIAPEIGAPDQRLHSKKPAIAPKIGASDQQLHSTDRMLRLAHRVGRHVRNRIKKTEV